MRKLRRALFSGTRKCTYGCQYCFAKFREYSAEHHLRMLPDHLPPDVSIIYPACDGEFFTDALAQNALKRLVHRTAKPLLISISVKSPITDKNIAYINDINGHLIPMGRGFLKCSISVSIKHGLEKIEPHTPRYGQRLDAARLLALHGIPRSVNLRPILPFVPVEEYAEVISDFVPFMGAFLIGGLYIDMSNSFGQSVATDYPEYITERQVTWLPGRPSWKYCENPDQLKDVTAAIHARQAQAFQSDTDVMDWLSPSPMAHLHAA